MTDVRIVPLGDIAEINPRADFRATADTRVQFVSMSAVDAETGEATPEERLYGDVSRGFTPFRDGDVLVAKITPCFENGKVAQARLSLPLGFGSTEFHVVRARPSDADTRYLFHYLRQPHIRRNGESRMTGSGGQRRVPRAFLAELSIPLPALSEQRRIADVLDQADELRAKRRRVLAQLDTLTQSIFADMFVSSSCDEWPVVTLGKTADILTGYAFQSHRFVPHGEPGVSLCRGINVLPGRIDWTDRACYPTDESEGFERFNLAPRDVVLAMDRPWIAEGFKIAQIAAEDCPALLVQRVTRLRATEVVMADFLFHLLRRPEFTRHCRPTETTVPHISPRDIKSFSFALPPVAVQSEFGRRARAFGLMRRSDRESLIQLDALFASLEYRAFRGGGL